jgi:phosphatidyl-myo-inositol dimannoside synthase
MTIVHQWYPQWDTRPGGIERYCATLDRALGELLPGATRRLFLKNDKPDEVPAAIRDRAESFGDIPSALRTARFALRLSTSQLEERPDLVLLGHLHFAPVLLGVPLVHRTPTFVFAYGREAWKGLPVVTRQALQRATRILSISQFTRRALIDRHGVSADRVVLLPCTVDDRRFRILEVPGDLRARYDLTGFDQLLLTVGRLDSDCSYKGIDRVLRVLPRLLAEFPRLRYAVVGDGDDRPRLEALCRELKLEEHVRFLGRVPEEDLVPLYNAATAFTMPSTGEGFGIVFLEAMACGVPVVAGNRDASAEALAGGDLGVIVDPLDEEALAAGLRGALTREGHPLFRDRLTLRAAMLERFGYETFRRTLARHLECVPGIMPESA